MDAKKLTYKQAIAIRDKYKYLIGRTINSPSTPKDAVKDLVVAPFYSDKLNSFFDTYLKADDSLRGNDHLLALSLEPNDYCVYVLWFNQFGGLFLHNNIFTALGELEDVDVPEDDSI